MLPATSCLTYLSILPMFHFMVSDAILSLPRMYLTLSTDLIQGDFSLSERDSRQLILAGGRLSLDSLLRFKWLCVLFPFQQALLIHSLQIIWMDMYSANKPFLYIEQHWFSQNSSFLAQLYIQYFLMLVPLLYLLKICLNYLEIVFIFEDPPVTNDRFM